MVLGPMSHTHDYYDFEWSHFFKFDPVEFIHWPFIRWPAGGADFPWANYFLRSSLFGEYEFIHWDTANVVSRILLPDLAAGLCAAILALKNQANRAALLLAVLIPLAASPAYLIMEHDVTSQDFRFVLPLLIPYSILVTQGLEKARLKGWFLFHGIAVGLIFALPIAGIYFYLTQYVRLFP